MEMNRIIDFDTLIVQKKGLDSASMDGEVVMMDIDRGKYYAFNCVGSRIWELIVKPLAVREIVSVLLEEFEIDHAACEASVLEFLNRLYEVDLISVA